MLKNTAMLVATTSILTLLTGCASIVGGTKEKVAISTGPVRGANCELENSMGKWHINQTPGTVDINRSSNDLKVNCKKSGYRGYTAVSSKTRNLTYGNIIIGGIIGTTIDMANGAAYEYPESISVPMHSA